jgi:coenzyme F420-0:L-glutamate ligase/coenzyme F420-1:gamma-L-glutamate ligase
MPRQVLPISPEIQQKIRAARVARLATVDETGTPHIVPVCFVYYAENFYSAVDRKPKRVAPERLARLRDIRANPRVALLIDEYQDDWTRLWYILVRGRAELVPESDGNARARAIGELRTKYPQYSRHMLGDDAPVIRIVPERITAWGKI